MPNYGRLRHPAQFIANLLRAFNARSADGTATSDGYLNPQSAAMGMDVFRPPSVFSYFSPCTGRARDRRSARARVRALLDVHRAARAPTSSTRWCSRRIDVERERADRHVARPRAAAGAGRRRRPSSSTRSTCCCCTARCRRRCATASSAAVTAVPATNPLKRARTAVYLVATSSQYQVER